MTEESLFYKKHIFCCTNERPPGHERGCCKDKGAETLRLYMKERIKELGIDFVRVNASGCLDCCARGPVMVIYPEGTWYVYSSKEDVDEIISTHVQKDGRVKRLQLLPAQKKK